ncbi:MAG: HAAS signaling domain-containing protein [Ruthenibacterium lactatiformans]
MTEQEKKIKRYVNAIERELRLPLKAKARINGDIGTDIHARLEKGQSIDAIIAEMGTPQEVAAGFNEEMQDQLLPKGSPWRWVFLIAAILAGGAALLSILPFLLFYFQSSGMGVIGGADGPTAIFITGAANFLARCSHRCGSPFPSFWDAAPPACCCAGGKTGRVQSIRLL